LFATWAFLTAFFSLLYIMRILQNESGKSILGIILEYEQGGLLKQRTLDILNLQPTSVFYCNN